MSRVLKIGVLGLGLMLGSATKINGQTDQVTTVLVGILEDWYKIHPGNAKSDLLKYFELDGGFWGPDKQTYISRRCPYIKIDVTFRVDPHTDSGSVITSVSRPYLDSPHAD
jgi:hypothetical protein